MIKAIDTHYKDHLFRSRLEARWAVYFDTLGVKWDYESEGFELENGRYLPDFYFPKYDFYGEIKPEGFGDKDLDKWTSFVTEMKKPLVVFEGLPHTSDCRIIYLDGFQLTDYHRVIPFADLTKTSYGVFWYCGGIEDWGVYNPYKAAISSAKKKRFEFT